MLDKKTKQRIINKFRVHENDTGSAEVQIALLTEEIKQLTNHLKDHRHDFSSRRGLFKKVGERKSLLRYLEKENAESYEEIIKKLKLKRNVRIERQAKEVAPETEQETTVETGKSNEE